MPRYLGQHFLKNKSVLKKIAGALDLCRGDVVIEIGPGHGELTEEIKNQISKIKIITIEKDRNLSLALRNKYSGNPDINIVEGDALKILPELTNHLSPSTDHYKLVGNIPYYITGHLLRIIGELKNKPQKTVLLVQKEVAQRICARPPRSSLLSLSVQFWAEPKIIETVSKKYFSPPPNVDSSIIELKTRLPSETLVKEGINADKEQLIYADKYYSFIKKAFKQPRKTLVNNLVAGGYKREWALGKIFEAGLRPGDRPGTLSREKIIQYFCCP